MVGHFGLPTESPTLNKQIHQAINNYLNFLNEQESLFLFLDLLFDHIVIYSKL